MKRFYLLIISVLFCSCSTIKTNIPSDYTYKEIKTKDYILASWQKIQDNNSVIRIYIEGDGNAYTDRGYPTINPTPTNDFFRNIAFNDEYKNVVYLARPCQYIKNKNSNSIDWTTGRFSQKIVDNMVQAIEQITSNNKIVLIGYSGGALLCGLIINQYKEKLNIVKWITIAGLLNHTAWTKYFNYVSLKDSLDLYTIPKIEQKHYIAKQDTIIPYQLTLDIVDIKDCIIFEDATHNDFNNKINSNEF